MKVKEIIEKSAELLGVELTKENTETLVSCYNLVENEIAVQYFPLRAIDKVLVKGNKIMYAELKKGAYRVLEVVDYQDNKLAYKIYPQHIELNSIYNGVYLYVRYNYVPKAKTIDEDCSYGLLEKDILSYGVCAEYCLTCADFNRARYYDGKYKHLLAVKYIKKGE